MYTQQPYYDGDGGQPVRARQVDFGISPMLMLQSANFFKIILSMEYVLYVKTQGFHWNVTGVTFNEFHKMFEKQYKQIGKYIDSVAEQIRQYNEFAPGSMQDMLNINKENGRPENAGKVLTSADMVKELLESHESIAYFVNTINKSLENTNIKSPNESLDLGSQDLLGRLAGFHQKSAWMLRSSL